jgi:hypothetical protein
MSGASSGSTSPWREERAARRSLRRRARSSSHWSFRPKAPPRVNSTDSSISTATSRIRFAPVSMK